MAVARKPEDTFVFRTTFIMSDETVMLVYKLFSAVVYVRAVVYDSSTVDDVSYEFGCEAVPGINFPIFVLAPQTRPERTPTPPSAL